MPRSLSSLKYDDRVHEWEIPSVHMGDAVYSQEALNRIFTQLTEQHQAGNAPGPASGAAIKALPTKQISEADHGEKDISSRLSGTSHPLTDNDHAVRNRLNENTTVEHHSHIARTWSIRPLGARRRVISRDAVDVTRDGEAAEPDLPSHDRLDKAVSIEDIFSRMTFYYENEATDVLNWLGTSTEDNQHVVQRSANVNKESNFYDLGNDIIFSGRPFGSRESWTTMWSQDMNFPREMQTYSSVHKPLGQRPHILPQPVTEPNDNGQAEESGKDSNFLDSDAASIFSEHSRATSMTSIHDVIGEAAVKNFIDVLFCSSELIELNVTAMLDPMIGRERFTRNVRRLIQACGNSLLPEADTIEERNAAHVLASRVLSAWIARKLVDHAADSISPLSDESTTPLRFSSKEDEIDDGASDASSSGDDDEDTCVAEFEGVKDFMLNSRAYLGFKNQLLHFVHRPHRERISATIIPGKQGSEMDWLQVDSVRFAAELPWVPADEVTISYTDLLSTPDYLKDAIEEWMGETWDWWPLRPRRQLLREGFGRVKWHCVRSLVSSRLRSRKCSRDCRFAALSDMLTCRVRTCASLKRRLAKRHIF